MKIEGIIWLREVVDKLWFKHHVEIEEVEEVLVDNLLYQLDKVNSNHFPFKHKELKESLGKYIFMTLHRPSNVDRRRKLEHIVAVLNRIGREIPIIFPVHPRTSKMLDRFGIELS